MPTPQHIRSLSFSFHMSILRKKLKRKGERRMKQGLWFQKIVKISKFIYPQCTLCHTDIRKYCIYFEGRRGNSCQISWKFWSHFSSIHGMFWCDCLNFFFVKDGNFFIISLANPSSSYIKIYYLLGLSIEARLLMLLVERTTCVWEGTPGYCSDLTEKKNLVFLFLLGLSIRLNTFKNSIIFVNFIFSFPVILQPTKIQCSAEISIISFLSHLCSIPEQNLGFLLVC